MLSIVLPFRILKLDDVFSDVFGKSSRSILSIIGQILEHPCETFDVTPFVDKRCKHPIEEIQATVDGTICPEQAAKLKICLDFIDKQEKRISELDKETFRLAEPYSAVLELMHTVPGLSKKPLTAIHLLSEIGSVMSVFGTSKHLVSLAGHCLRNDAVLKGKVNSHLSYRFLSENITGSDF